MSNPLNCWNGKQSASNRCTMNCTETRSKSMASGGSIQRRRTHLCLNLTFSLPLPPAASGTFEVNVKRYLWSLNRKYAECISWTNSFDRPFNFNISIIRHLTALMCEGALYNCTANAVVVYLTFSSSAKLMQMFSEIIQLLFYSHHCATYALSRHKRSSLWIHINKIFAYIHKCECVGLCVNIHSNYANIST